MAAYFQDLRSKVVLKAVLPIDIQAFREQISDYTEVSEEVYNEYHGIQPKKAEKPTK